MAVASCLTLKIGAYHFISGTWVLNTTDKSRIVCDPSVSYKCLCCRLLKGLNRTSGEQLVHREIGEMGSSYGYFMCLGIWFFLCFWILKNRGLCFFWILKDWSILFFWEIDIPFLFSWIFEVLKYSVIWVFCFGFSRSTYPFFVLGLWRIDALWFLSFWRIGALYFWFFGFLTDWGTSFSFSFFHLEWLRRWFLICFVFRCFAFLRNYVPPVFLDFERLRFSFFSCLAVWGFEGFGRYLVGGVETVCAQGYC